MIVAIKKACKSARPLLRHVYLKTGRLGREVAPLTPDADRVVGIVNGLDVGTVTRSPAVDAKSLCSEVPRTRAQLRHVVLSMEDTPDPADRAKAFEALADLSEQWMEEFAPGSAFIGVLHDDRSHPHCHLLIANLAPFEADGRLNWKPSDLKKMQSLEWVAPATAEKFSLEPGRHQGVSRREGAGMPYPSPLLDAAALAMATLEELQSYETANIISIGRRSSDGEIKSINYNGRRIRLSTIRQMAQHRQGVVVQSRPARRRGLQRQSRPGLCMA